eukprot:15464386-Alexandrium_andersonii.AAC.1
MPRACTSFPTSRARKDEAQGSPSWLRPCSLVLQKSLAAALFANGTRAAASAATSRALAASTSFVATLRYGA